jgi:peptidyl-dipeptidase A
LQSFVRSSSASFILERSDLFEKPGKNQHAFCINLDREGEKAIIN